MRDPLEYKVGIHKCSLKKTLVKEGRRWACDGRHFYPSGCIGGVNDFGDGVGKYSYKCKEHDFDLCKQCAAKHSQLDSMVFNSN